MRKCVLFLLAAAGWCGFSSCAGYRIKKVDAADTTTEGLRYCRSAPYLLVSSVSTPAAETAAATVAYQVVYLPDPAQTYVIQRHGGLGTVNVTAALTESGLLTQFGGATDSKVPNLITAIGGVLPSVTGLKVRAQENGASAVPAPRLYKILFEAGNAAGIRLVEVQTGTASK
ncbi:hypothetical protein [Hymenobacter sp. PAMC 26628]|uniref:hypothetical protein n=1 Tax=Hymenobacter sp. PAMC 26628 TaxID=1484118 RepID=UPI0007705A1E|nr:hypothetical protein [Hymenobacter sp. PAMC 26628]AMJ67662.1 hypothetical protein AXW84_21265 [Hymenobacter sp. PAMC 26628]